MAIPIDLSGRTALITGATGQIGRVIADTLAIAGANIVIHYNQNEKQARELQHKIHNRNAYTALVSGNAYDLDNVMRWQSQISAQLDTQPDIIVIAAVEQIFPWQSVLEESIEDFQSQFNCCALQTVCLAKAFAPSMMENNFGRFIGINTEVAMRLDACQSAYGAGKRAMDGVLRVLAKEISDHNITVNQVAPGWTICEKDRSEGNLEQPEYTQHVPMNRRGDDQDVANAIAFLASDLASFINGCFLPVTGGTIMPTI